MEVGSHSEAASHVVGAETDSHSVPHSHAAGAEFQDWTAVDSHSAPLAAGSSAEATAMAALIASAAAVLVASSSELAQERAGRVCRDREETQTCPVLPSSDLKVEEGKGKPACLLLLSQLYS